MSGSPDVLRIATWNLAGRWSDDHRGFLEDLRGDVLLLTEVSDRVELPGIPGHVSNAQMARKRFWAGVWSREHQVLEAAANQSA